jgi:hypothetical protein
MPSGQRMRDPTLDANITFYAQQFAIEAITIGLGKLAHLRHLSRGTLAAKVSDDVVKYVDNVVGFANSAPKVTATFTTKQLEKKWKHAVDFGITTTKRNPTTLAEYQAAITGHLDDADTVVKRTYGWVDNSVTHFNPKTNLVVVLDDAGNFITGWKLKPGTPQFEKFIKDGFLK